MRTISIINLKGGVAKTISAVNIAHILSALHRKRVLLVDNDKQGNASKLLNLYDYEKPSISDIMTDPHVVAGTIIRPSGYAGLDVIPANMDLLKANLDVLLDMSRPQQTRMVKALERVEDTYDYCVIDNPPDINMSVINALVASNDVLVPIKVDKFAFDGMEQLIEQIDRVRDWNPGIRFRGCFVTMFQGNSVNRQGDEWLKSGSGFPILSTKIRKTTKVDESTFARQPLLVYARSCTATRDYQALVNEYLKIIS